MTPEEENVFFEVDMLEPIVNELTEQFDTGRKGRRSHDDKVYQHPHKKFEFWDLARLVQGYDDVPSEAWQHEEERFWDWQRDDMDCMWDDLGFKISWDENGYHLIADIPVIDWDERPKRDTADDPRFQSIADKDYVDAMTDWLNQLKDVGPKLYKFMEAGNNFFTALEEDWKTKKVAKHIVKKEVEHFRVVSDYDDLEEGEQLWDSTSKTWEGGIHQQI